MNLLISLFLAVLLLNVVAGQSESGAWNGAHQGGKGIWNLQWIFNGAGWDDGQDQDSSKEGPTSWPWPTTTSAAETTTQYPEETVPATTEAPATESWAETTEYEYPTTEAAAW